jgi:ADP-heptose:LPS heptosyltransferase
MPVQYLKHKVVFNRILEIAALVLLWPFLIYRKTPSMQCILLVEPFGMGDVLSLSVMLDPLLKAYPGVKIMLLVKQGNEDIYETDDRVFKTFSAPIPWSRIGGQKHASFCEWVALWKTCRQIALLKPDVGVDTRSEIRSQILMCLCGCRKRVGFNNYLNTNINVCGWFLTKCVNNRPGLHRFERNRVLLSEGLGIDPGELRFPTFKPRSNNHAGTTGSVRVLLHVGARWRYKKWPVECWCELVRRLVKRGLEPIVAGAPSEQGDVGLICDAVKGARPVSADMGMIVELVQDCDLLICLDSGPMNLAATLAVPVISLFGPGDYDMWHPLGVSDRAVFHRLPCNPCLQRTCSRPQHSCMSQITIDEVWDAVCDSLSRIDAKP